MSDLLKRYIQLQLKEELVREGKISASRDYLRKEAIREKIQSMLTDAVASGDIKSADDLKSFFSTIDMATSALKGVPIEVWLRTASKPKVKK